MKLDLDDRNALLARYKSRLQSGQAAIFERYLAEADAPRLLHERCQLVDDLLRELWTELCFPQSLALLAVGGYGAENCGRHPMLTCSCCFRECPTQCSPKNLSNWLACSGISDWR